MDLYAVLADLVAERKRVDMLIRTLEALQDGRALPSEVIVKGRRGRKFMGPEERMEVSARMRRYWEAKREARGGSVPLDGGAR